MATAPKMVSFPIKPTDPVIVMINFMIKRHTDEINWRRNMIQKSLNRLGDIDGKTPIRDRELADALVSYEVASDTRRDYFIDVRQLADIQSDAARVAVLEEIVRDLTCMKLRLFGDVDFHGGRDYVKEINRMFTEGHTRVEEKKAAEKKFRRDAAARQRKWLKRQAMG